MSLAMMIDLETMGTRPTSCIIQIGAVLFEPRSGGQLFNNSTFNRYIRVDDRYGTVDHDSIQFWMRENKFSNMAEKMGTAIHLLDALHQFYHWPGDVYNITWENIEVWAKPSDFDLPILAHAFSQTSNLGVPWRHWNTRCARTLFHNLGLPEVDRTGFTLHDAADDAVVQAMMVQKALRNGQETKGR